MSQRVYVAGHGGLLGGALARVIATRDDLEFVCPAEHVDLRDPTAATRAIAAGRPDAVVLAAAKVGGLGANIAEPVAFLEDNLLIELNVLRAAFAAGVERVLFVASANAYPADAAQPIAESALGTGSIDPDTEPYGLAKLAGIRLCDAYSRQYGVRYHSVIPSNLYGPGDRFDPATAHVVAATLRRFGDACATDVDEVTVWGSGRQRRQLLYVDDLARACVMLLGLSEPPAHVNVGPRGDTEIAELAQLAAKVVGFDGSVSFDQARPEGVRRRELDTSRAYDLGWHPEVSLEDGMRTTWKWFQAQAGTTPTSTGKESSA